MIGVVINYCSNEKIFIDISLEQCQKFSDDIVVSYGSHLYDGTPEDVDHISELQNRYPRVKFVKYPVDVELDLTKQKGVINRPGAYWHNLARWHGVKSLSASSTSWVFVIDADEIPHGDQVKSWLTTVLRYLDPAGGASGDTCFKLACFWYFKYPTNRSQTLEDSILLIHRKHLTSNNIFNDLERDDLVKLSNCKLHRMVRDINSRVMWSHYSFVRSRKALTHKMKFWGHRDEYDNVDKLISDMYLDDSVNDFIHNYQYDKVPNKFGIILEKVER